MPDLHQENKKSIVTGIRDICLGFLDILYPRLCFACDKSLHEEKNTYICESCLEIIEATDARRCSKCGLKLGAGITSSSKGCPECNNTNLRFEKSFFVSDNTEPVRTLIHQFKYKKHICLATPLGSLLINLLRKTNICEIDCVVPVPLHWRKKRERGFNQSELMAKKICKKLSIPISTNNLHRIKNTLSQTQLSRLQRQRNVKGAFMVKNPEKFYQKNILLVDDVFTTGMTASECAKSLKNAGTNKIFLIALARSKM
ncbi:MAG: ComF family protein [Candidatus Scalindua sp.]